YTRYVAGRAVPRIARAKRIQLTPSADTRSNVQAIQSEAASKRGLTLRSSRLAAVRWPGASAPRASLVQVSVWPAREGRERLSERTLGRYENEGCGGRKNALSVPRQRAKVIRMTPAKTTDTTARMLNYGR